MSDTKNFKRDKRSERLEGIERFGSTPQVRWEDMDAVRKRPGMYVGDTGTGGLHQLFKEIIDNSISEVLAGDYCTKINVVYDTDHSLSVEDNGRGIPIGIDEESGKTFVELVLTELNIGLRLRPTPNKISGGLHGVGASVVNALSTWMECEIRHDGKVYRQRFAQGKPTAPLAIVGDCPPHESGTKVTWLADATIFRTFLYSPDLLRDRIRELAYLHQEVAISFQDRQNNAPPETYHYEHGIADYVSYLNYGKATIHPAVIYIEDTAEDMHIEVALQFTTDTSEMIRSYVNNIHTIEDGTHVAGFKKALTRTLNRFARKNGLAETPLTSDIVGEGLTAVVSLRLPNPSFNRSTKDHLTNREVEYVVNRVVGKGILKYLNSQPEAAHAIIAKALSAQEKHKTN